MSSNITSIVNDLWPTSSCDQFSARPIIPTTSGDRICGLQTSNETLMTSCCVGATVKQYQCWMYCSYPDTYESQDFSQCIANHTIHTGTGTVVGTPSFFCEENVKTTSNETVSTSFGTRRFSTPRLSWIVLVVLFSFFFIGPTSATTLPAHDNSLTRRDSGCTFSVEKNFAKSGNYTNLSDEMNCQVSICFGDFPVDTGMNNINRTINGNSAADSSYDQFFDIVSNATQGRKFPAQSRLQMNYSYGASGGGSYFLQFIPLYWCVNGTATNCKGTFGDTNDAQQVTACGPLLVGDATTANETDGLDVNAVQGTMNIVRTS